MDLDLQVDTHVAFRCSPLGLEALFGFRSSALRIYLEVVEDLMGVNPVHPIPYSKSWMSDQILSLLWSLPVLQC